MPVNGSFSPADSGAVFDIDRYIHELDYAEGNSLCNG